MTTMRTGLALVACALLGVQAAVAAADGIELHIVPDQGDGFYRLYWSGGREPYDVYRSTDEALVVVSTNRLGETRLTVWIDEPPPQGVYYYQVVSACDPACVAGEICCSEACCSLPNATPGCGGAGFGCVVESCDPNYWNRNGVPSDGCEFFCDTPSMTDFPDASGTDQNCDLVDGEVDDAVFVAKWGDDADDGSLGSPKRSVQAGIDAAVILGKRDVYVAAGLYFEEIEIAPGVGVYGGYDTDFYDRDASVYETILAGSNSTPSRPGTVNALAILGQPPGSSVLDGFTVFAPDLRTPEASSYGIYVRDSDQSLRISNNRIYGGYGGDGTRGADGNEGTFGADGAQGLDGVDLFAAYGVSGHGCTAIHHLPGGAGGNGFCDGSPTGGGDGGESACAVWDGVQTLPPAAEEAGGTGQHVGGGAGGAAGWDVYQLAMACAGFTVYGALPGAAGADGLVGYDGSGGAGCPDSSGSVLAGQWVAGPASAGGDGLHGGGGGGGGAGAGAWVHESCLSRGFETDNLGGSGGGGGAGGCGGTGGGEGSGGGGSFAVFLTFSAASLDVPEIVDNVLYTGGGGRGGDGGNAGSGGRGGSGAGGGGGVPWAPDPADPLYPVFPAFAGGAGGRGGEGGGGGGGGGGCGGPSYGIYVWNVLAPESQGWEVSNLIVTSGSGGSGGLGGASRGAPGGTGTNGTHAPTNF